MQFTPPNTKVRAANATVQFDQAAFSPNGGPLQVSYPNYANAISSWLGGALTELGLKQVNGFANGVLLGWQYVGTTIDPTASTRSSSETSFLRQAIQKTTNLAMYKSTTVKRVLFSGNKTAIGVEVNSGGTNYQIFANNEVIVSAGTVN